MMPGLMMMMRCGVVVSGRLMMMLMRWMLRHLNFLLLELDIPPNSNPGGYSKFHRELAAKAKSTTVIALDFCSLFVLSWSDG
jgi:hypothetical protein